MEIESKNFEHAGRRFRASIQRDSHTGAPWDEEDGHGPVSEWTTRPKAPGERVFLKYRDTRRYYDVFAATRIAKRDHWGVPPGTVRDGATPGEIARAAVERDFERLRAWAHDEWHYVGVVVTEIRPDDSEIADRSESLWGIESDAGDYLETVALELAEQIVSAFPRAVLDEAPRRVAEISAEAADDVASYIRERFADNPQWVEVADALLALVNDTDAIVLRADKAPATS